MHNLHLCVIRASNAEEAEARVESSISDWGDSNNWRTICGSVSEDDDLHSNDDGPPSVDSLGTIAQINGWLGSLICKPFIAQDAAQAVLREMAAGQTVSDMESIILAEHYLYHVRQVERAKAMSPVPDVLRQELYPYVFDEFGVTNIGGLYDWRPGKHFVVFVDMHS